MSLAPPYSHPGCCIGNRSDGIVNVATHVCSMYRRRGGSGRKVLWWPFVLPWDPPKNECATMFAPDSPFEGGGFELPVRAEGISVLSIRLGQKRRLGRSASASPAEFVMDAPLEGAGSESSVPLAQPVPENAAGALYARSAEMRTREMRG